MKVLKQRSQSLMFTRKKNRCNEHGRKNITTSSQFQLFLCVYQKLNCSPPWTFWRVAILLSISTMLLFILTKRVVEFQFHDIHVCVCPWTYVHVRAWKPEVSIRHLSSLLYSLLFLREGLSLNLRVQPSCDIPLFQLSSDICSHKYNLWTYRKQAFPISFLILGIKVDRLVYMMDIGSNQHHSLSHPTVLPKFPCSYGMLGLKKKKNSHILKLTLKTYSLT